IKQVYNELISYCATGIMTSISAHRASHSCGHQETPDPGHDQQAGDIIKFVRTDFDTKHVEAPASQIDQHRLIGGIRPAIPPYPRCDIIYSKGNRHDDPF